MKVDLHTHTWHSDDSWLAPGVLVERARAAGLDRIAVTDHGEIDGAFEAHAIDPQLVIVGQEVRCEGGTELIGLFLRERIPMRLPVEETAERIHAQGGVIYAPHPFAYASRGRWHAQRALAVADIIEVFNSRAFLPVWNRSALAAAGAGALPGAASSDAHFPWELGRAYTVLPDFTDGASLLVALQHAHAVGVRTANPFIHVASVSLEQVRRAGRALRRPVRRFAPVAQIREPAAG